MRFRKSITGHNFQTIIKLAKTDFRYHREVINKDHQRMMVDPMFMIVLNLRSFLTAVTSTAVTPIAVATTEVILKNKILRE